jgi:hypothetical protein
MTPDCLDALPLYRCAKCGQHKAASAFHVRRARKRGVQSRCKDCSRLQPDAQTVLYQARAVLRQRLEAGQEIDEQQATRLIPLLHRMRYDDALVYDVWRLELLYLETGKPHYRLYWHNAVFGVADIYTEYGDLTDSCHMPLVRARMAAYLVGCGWQVSEVTLERDTSITPLDADTKRQYRLFKVKATQTRRTEWQIIEENWLGPEMKGVHTARQA